jgi:hypothetical protein
MPLIAGSEYREIVAVSRGASYSAEAGDRQNALAQLILAINPRSDLIKSAGIGLNSFTNGEPVVNPLGWLGQFVTVSVDRDPFWEEVAKLQTEGEREKFIDKHFDRLPFSVLVDVSNGFKLTAFLVGLRKFVDQAGPGMTTWETREYRGESYVRVAPTPRALPPADNGQQPNYQLLYAASGKYFFVTPSEPLLKRFLDRQIAVRPAEQKDGKATGPEKPDAIAPAAENASEPRSQPWLGSSLGLQVDQAIVPLLASMFGRDSRNWLQIRSWSNLPILNEWRRLYPDQDPVELHHRIWHEKLVCPGGGQYVWNAEWQTMESTVYGHPGQPKAGPFAPPGMLDYSFANFGLTFEEHGLRARVTLDRATPPEKAASSTAR